MAEDRSPKSMTVGACLTPQIGGWPTRRMSRGGGATFPKTSIRHEVRRNAGARGAVSLKAGARAAGYVKVKGVWERFESEMGARP